MSVLPASLRGYVYRPRSIAFLGHRPIGRWQVKGTVVTVRGTAAHFADIVEGAWAEGDRLLAGIADDGRDAGVAGLIVHLGLGGVALSLDWWSDGDTLRSRSIRSSFDDPTRFAEIGPGRAGSSVWELAIRAHERDAWTRHVLHNAAGPDLAAYLDDGVNGMV